MLFLQEARRSAALLPPEAGRPATAEIEALLSLVKGTAPPDSLDAHVRSLNAGLSERLGVTLDELPAQTPSLSRGAEIYQANCAGCHGAVGRGDGTLAAGLDPRPANLADGAALRDVSPLDYFRRISIGTVGTAMPAFEGRLPAEDRWAAALYASVLRRAGATRRRAALAPRLRDDRQDVRRRGAHRARHERAERARGARPACRGPHLPGRPHGRSVRAGLRAGAPPARLGVRPRPHGRSRRERPRVRRVHDLRAGRARRAGQESRRWPPSWRPPSPRSGPGPRAALRRPSSTRSGGSSTPGSRTPSARSATRGHHSTCSCSRSSSCCAKASRRS